MTALCLPSPAKINLFLHVIGQKPDGYHQLQTVFQFLDFCDQLTFKLRQDDRIIVRAPGLDLPEENNLITRAARLLQEELGCDKGIEVSLIKKIPLGAGLGGGSSNAATTLVALNMLWNTKLTKDSLLQLGLKLGADVPIFIHGEAAFGQGIGEQLESIELPEDWVLLLLPNCKVDTGKIFSDSQLTRNTRKITIAEFFAKGGHNDCEPIAKKYFPDIAKALDCLSQYSTAKMTGTGCGVFATFKNKETAQEVAKRIPASLNGVICKGRNLSPMHNAIRYNWGVAKR